MSTNHTLHYFIMLIILKITMVTIPNYIIGFVTECINLW